MIEDFKGDDLVPLFQGNPANARCAAAGCADFFFCKSNRFSVSGRKEYLLLTVRELDADNLVFGPKSNGDDAVATRIGIGHEFRFFDLPFAGRKDNKTVVLEFSDREKGGNFLSFLQRQKIDEGFSLGNAAALRNFMDFHPVHFAD